MHFEYIDITIILFKGCLEGLCATSLMILQPQNQQTKSNFQRNASLQERHSRFKYDFTSYYSLLIQ